MKDDGSHVTPRVRDPYPAAMTRHAAGPPLLAQANVAPQQTARAPHVGGVFVLDSFTDQRASDEDLAESVVLAVAKAPRGSAVQVHESVERFGATVVGASCG